MTESDERSSGPSQAQPDRSPQRRRIPWTPAARAEMREEQQRLEAERAIRLADSEVQGLAMKALPVVSSPTAPAWQSDTPQEVIDAARAKERAENEQAFQTFKNSLLNREIDAYLKGVDMATDREAKRAINIRSIVLLLVVLAVVAMPIVAIIADLSPQDFGSYIAPVTGIAGTVVGYWFGAGERSQTRS